MLFAGVQATPRQTAAFPAQGNLASNMIPHLASGGQRQRSPMAYRIGLGACPRHARPTCARPPGAPALVARASGARSKLRDWQPARVRLRKCEVAAGPETNLASTAAAPHGRSPNPHDRSCVRSSHPPACARIAERPASPLLLHCAASCSAIVIVHINSGHRACSRAPAPPGLIRGTRARVFLRPHTHRHDGLHVPGSADGARGPRTCRRSRHPQRQGRCQRR